MEKKVQNKTPNIKVFDFANQNIPLPIESRNTSDSTFVTWGFDNQYPAYLLDIYSKSPVHNSVVNQKTNYIIGNGLKLDANVLSMNINPSESIHEVTSKIIKDYLLFNAFAVEVIFNVFNEPIEFHHIPVHKLRMNRNKTKFWFNNDWLYSRQHIIYDKYIPMNNKDSNSKIFYFDGYFPTIRNVYATPEYEGCIKSIATDIAIEDFNLNNIKNQFSVNTIITFFNGANISEEVKKQITFDIEQKFMGENGRKFIVDFQQKDSKPADIKPLSVGDWDKAYIQIHQNTIDSIVQGHQCQNPSLFGIKSAGQLGNTQELQVSYEILKGNYINVKRAEIETAFANLYLNFKPLYGSLKFADKPLFETQLDDKTKLLIYTINELRALSGLPALAGGDRLLTDVQTVTPQPTPQAVPPIPEISTPTVAQPAQPEQPDDVKKKVSKKLSENDFELIKHLGQNSQDFEIIEKGTSHRHQKFNTENQIADYIISKKVNGITLNDLVDELKNAGIKTTPSDLSNILDDLNKSGLLNTTIDNNNVITVNPIVAEPNTDVISVMYKYVLRDDVDGGDIINTTRSFCRRLIENGRYYTRQDIQTMSLIFGYSVFDYCGGFYHNPDTDETTPYCRHQWQSLKVKRK